jgi:hypothetical protein
MKIRNEEFFPFIKNNGVCYENNITFDYKNALKLISILGKIVPELKDFFTKF